MLFVAFIHVHPSHSDGRTSGDLPRSMLWHFDPYPFAVEEVELDHPGFLYQFVLEDLARQIVAIRAAVPVFWTITVFDDLFFIVCELNAVTSFLE